MRARTIGLFALVVGLGAAAGLTAFGQPTPSKPTWLYGHDLRVRKGGTTDFNAETPKVGIEFFKDEPAGALVAVTESGSLAVLPVVPVSADGEKKATWLFGHDMRARKASEEKFSKETTKYGVEVYKDTATGKILYISEKGYPAFADAPQSFVSGSEKEAEWHHALVLKVRSPDQSEFNEKTPKFGVEVFKDGNTGGLVYISETGSISTAASPGTPVAKNSVKPPTALYGLELRVRKADEPNFEKDKTPHYGVEVFKDENAGVLIYVSQSGSIATVPVPMTDLKSNKGVKWTHAMTLKARPSGVKEFAKAAKFGVEVFQDNNSGYLVFISETGAIAVLAK
ncbi:hypothetical protein [Fimbriiglobus ruber]|uniref:Uncharacterized protein n=1 Tax=Fimbriiglobus ruber TaxID=1908690 RepID=A0A225E5J5_9BACT|nr:hypothetical protein [Fimbriiglobus ruber]OWK43697.1 hypothetical protein FRUB_03296 [Fimbriiglobus ruber]